MTALKLWCAAAAATIFGSFCLGAQTSQPSLAEIQRWLADLDNTRDLVLESEYKPPMGRADWDRQNTREGALYGLAESADGARALAGYWLGRYQDGVTPNLQEVAARAAYALGQALAKNADAVPVDELRRFLLSMPLCRRSLDLPRIVDALPFTKLVELRAVWLSWLEVVEPAELAKGPYNSLQPRAFLAMTASTALGRTLDPAGLSRALEILHGMRNGRWAELAEYVEAMGASDAFPELLRLARSSQDNVMSVRELRVANESQACAYLLAALDSKPEPLHFPEPFYADLWGSRPDLMRGVAPRLLQNPQLRNLWASASSPTHTQLWARQVFLLGGQVLAPRQVLREALAAERQGRLDWQLAWIEALGRNDDSLGNSQLIHWASRPQARLPEEDDLIRWAAAKALFRRSLMSHGPKLITRLGELAPADRGAVAEAMLESVSLVRRRGALVVERGVGRDADVRKVSLDEARAGSLSHGVLVANQEKLIPWIGWIPDPDRLFSIYAQMSSEEARGRFLAIMAKGGGEAIHLAWSFSFPVPTETLRPVLSLPRLSDDSRVFVRLMLSEQGDADSYRFLKSLLLTSTSQPSRPRFRFTSAIVDEMVRRHDGDGLLEAIKNASSTDESLAGESESWGNGGLSAEDRLIAMLLRIDPSAALSRIQDLDPCAETGAVRAITIATVAATPNAEPLLRQAEPVARTWRTFSPSRREYQVNLPRWVYALRLTATAWCRDQLVREEAWGELAELGDRRAFLADQAGNALHPPDTSGVHFLLGDTRGAVSRVELSRPDPFIARLWVRPNLLSQLAQSLCRERLMVAVNDFLTVLPRLSTPERVTALSLLPPDEACWPDDLIRLLLRDDFAPVRLTALMHLLEHPRSGFDGEMEHIERSDRFPWCRRLAHEVRVFRPDPLNPKQGIRFSLPY